MSDLLQASFSALNAIPTTLLLLTLVYWMSVFIGLLDMDFLDVEVEVEADVDFDADVDTDVDHAGHPEAGISWLNNVLAFFNLGRIPVMVFLSFLALPWWFISVMANHYLGNSSLVIALLLLIPELILAAFLAKLLTTPFVSLFAKLNQKEVTKHDYVGTTGTITVSATESESGEIEINQEGKILLLDVIATTGRQLSRGDTALLVDYQTENKYFVAEPYEHPS